MKTVAIVGVGLIGGSFGLALRQAGFDGEIIGVSSPQAIEAAIAAGAVSASAPLHEAAQIADLMYLAQPVDRILSTVRTLGPITPESCLVTDAGSTKVEIVREAAAHFPNGNFIGGHPLAGKETRGAQSADPELFRARPYVLTPTGPESASQAQFKIWLDRIGAVLLEMSPEEHDYTVASTSHLPQLLSTALAVTLSERNDQYLSKVFGPGLIDMTRLALSSPDLWLSILSTNKSEVGAALDFFLERLTRLRDAVETDDLERWFATGSTFAASLRK